jgi:hypothetical protein
LASLGLLSHQDSIEQELSFQANHLTQSKRNPEEYSVNHEDSLFNDANI